VRHEQAQTDKSIYLTPAQVADLLQVSTKTVSRWSLMYPSMPATRIGRVVRFERSALFAWLQRYTPRTARRTQQLSHES
jgi:excisionase family DNA binding protein